MKEIIKIKSAILFVIVVLFFFNVSCKKEAQVEPVGMQEEDCTYQFGTTLEPIEGIWEPKTLIILETADTINYEVGKGHGGFMLDGSYGDSFELRENGELSIYYAELGRHCVSSRVGSWHADENEITFELSTYTFKTPILRLSDEELIIEDIVNFKESITILRKRN